MSVIKTVRITRLGRFMWEWETLLESGFCYSEGTSFTERGARRAAARSSDKLDRADAYSKASYTIDRKDLDR